MERKAEDIRYRAVRPDNCFSNGLTSPARFGEITRGMLVVDRREDESAYAPGANRAAVQLELDKTTLSHATWESTALPAMVEVTDTTLATINSRVASSVFCVTHTPGSDILLLLLLQRVWGIDCSLSTL